MSEVILVTGGNTGLGYGILASLSQQHAATYVLCSRSLAAGEAAAAQLRAHTSSAIETLELDVTDDTQIAAAVQSIKARHGKLDVLVNNAGILRPAGWEGMSLREVYTQTFAVNTVSAAVLTAEFLPLLRLAPAPKVVSVTSGLGSVANALAGKVPQVPTYGGSKVGLNGVMAHMQGQERQAGGALRFYVVQPGVVRTSFTQHARGKDPKDGAEVVVRLLLDGHYPGGTYWEFEDGEMRQVPW